jgi:hypothetical protein
VELIYNFRSNSELEHVTRPIIIAAAAVDDDDAI